MTELEGHAHHEGDADQERGEGAAGGRERARRPSAASRGRGGRRWARQPEAVHAVTARGELRCRQFDLESLTTFRDDWFGELRG
jgi:hypothetical protein